MFDPFWARVNEAGITVVVHAGDAGLSSNGYARRRLLRLVQGRARPRPSIKMFAIERAAHDFLATLILEKLFDRFPNVRVASVENGSEFLAPLFRKLRTTTRRMPGYFSEDPVVTFRRHVWINPFWEDDVDEIVDLMGDDRVIFGSDWPHIEGLPEPTDWVTELQKLPPESVAKIMGGNVSELNERRPAAMTEVVDQSETVASTGPVLRSSSPTSSSSSGPPATWRRASCCPGCSTSPMSGMMPEYRIVGSSTQRPDRRGLPPPGPPGLRPVRHRTRSRCCSGPTSRSA